VTELIHAASDDQIALAACFGALLVSGCIMYVSYPLRQLVQRSADHRETEPGLRVASLAKVAAERTVAESQEKAA